jgi:hypothetical protein
MTMFHVKQIRVKMYLMRRFLLLVPFLLLTLPARPQTVANLTPVPNIQFFDCSTGVCLPAAGGSVYSYVAGTSTPLATCQSSTMSGSACGTANTNPITLNAGGFNAASSGNAGIWLLPRCYKFVLQNAASVTVWTQDNVCNAFGLLAAATGAAQIGYEYPGSSTVRTVAARLADYMDVKDFGAVGNGSTDDAAAVQAALNASAGGGPTAFATSGTYLITTATLTTGGNAALVCQNATFKAGANITTLAVDGDGFYHDGCAYNGNESANASWGKWVITVNSSDSVDFNRIKISNNANVGSGITTNGGIKVCNGSNFTLRNSSITSTGSYNGAGGSADGPVAVYASSMGACPAGGTATTSVNAQVVDNRLENPGGSGCTGTCGNTVRFSPLDSGAGLIDGWNISGNEIVHGAGRIGAEVWAEGHAVSNWPTGKGGRFIGNHIVQETTPWGQGASFVLQDGAIIDSNVFNDQAVNGGPLIGTLEMVNGSGRTITGNSEVNPGTPPSGSQAVSLLVDGSGSRDTYSGNTFPGALFINLQAYTSETGRSLDTFNGNSFAAVPNGSVGNGAIVLQNGAGITLQNEIFSSNTLVGTGGTMGLSVAVDMVNDGTNTAAMSHLQFLGNNANNFLTALESGGSQTPSAITTKGNDWGSPTNYTVNAITFAEQDDVGYAKVFTSTVTAAYFAATSSVSISGCSATLGTGSTAFNGYYTSGTSGSCSVTITFPVAAAHYWVCAAPSNESSRDSSHLQFYNVASAQTGTITGTTVSGDIVSWAGCAPF